MAFQLLLATEDLVLFTQRVLDAGVVEGLTAVTHWPVVVLGERGVRFVIKWLQRQYFEPHMAATRPTRQP